MEKNHLEDQSVNVRNIRGPERRDRVVGCSVSYSWSHGSMSRNKS